MRKVHYQVVLDVFTDEDDNADGVGILEEADFWPNFDFDVERGISVQDVMIKSIKVTDPH